jgi:CRP-like cAMP-binding protein
MNSNTGKSETGASCEYEENLGILRQVDFFSGLPLEATKVFAFLCEREHFRKGEVLFEEGDEDGKAYYFISGKAELLRQHDAQWVTLRVFEAGDFIGRLALLGNVRRLFTLKADDDLTCLVLTKEKFKRALEQFPELMPKIMKVAVQNVNEWEKGFLKTCAADDRCDACRGRTGVSLV